MLVNSAGIYRVGALEEVTPEAWDATLAVNLRGTFLVCRAVLPGMLARGRGSVVNLSSISGRTKATLAAPSYVASKAGVIGLTMSLAAQGAARGVRVNAVAPGPADTEMIRTLDQEHAGPAAADVAHGAPGDGAGGGAGDRLPGLRPAPRTSPARR